MGTASWGPDDFEVRSPWDQRLVGMACYATSDEIEAAVAGAAAAHVEGLANVPARARAAVLHAVSRELDDRREEFARLITSESGKPISFARLEVRRSAAVFTLAAEEAKRWSGTAERLDTDATADGRLGLIRRFPRGAVLAITPFNFPLNLVARKVAPAIAVGAPVLLKPALKTPLSGAALAEVVSRWIAHHALPAGAFGMVVVPDDETAALTRDPRLPVVSFTGSAEVGWQIADAVPRKHLTLELGGNAAAIVCPDWTSPEDVRRAAARIALFANAHAGQSCIAVQSVIAVGSPDARLTEEVVGAVESLRSGDPGDEQTQVGPVIDIAAADRIQQWTAEALAGGARLLTGGQRDGTTLEPVVLTEVPVAASIAEEEVFGPVLHITPAADLEDAFVQVNSSRFGLQVGIFTRSLDAAFHAHRALQVGGVVIGDVPTFRADQMPYGGTKDSGLGREGVRYAMEDLTYDRVLVLPGL